MNIIQIIPGSGGSFYCGNCLRDSKYFNALRAEGHQVTKIPMYLPLFADEHDISDVPIFYGAISTYLKQLYPVFESTPMGRQYAEFKADDETCCFNGRFHQGQWVWKI
jgi:hypothetical protein